MYLIVLQTCSHLWGVERDVAFYLEKRFCTRWFHLHWHRFSTLTFYLWFFLCWLVSPRNHIEVKKKHKINSNKCSIGWCNLFPMRINQWNGKNSRKFIAWEIKLFNRFFFLQSWSTFTSIFNTKYLITIGKKTVFFIRSIVIYFRCLHFMFFFQFSFWFWRPLICLFIYWFI